MTNKKDEDYLSFEEKQVTDLISRLILEIQKLKDENESLWFMLEDIQLSDAEATKAIKDSLRKLEIYKESINKKPAEA